MSENNNLNNTEDTKMSEQIVETDKIVEGEDTKMSGKWKIVDIASNAATGCVYAAAAFIAIGVLWVIILIFGLMNL